MPLSCHSALLTLLLTTRGSPGGVGSLKLTKIEAVRVRGGFGRQPLSISAIAAVQFPWQSISVETMPPLTMPGKAQNLAGIDKKASNPSGIRLLFKCRPSGCAGPKGEEQTNHYPGYRHSIREKGTGAYSHNAALPRTLVPQSSPHPKHSELGV